MRQNRASVSREIAVARKSYNRRNLESCRRFKKPRMRCKQGSVLDIHVSAAACGTIRGQTSVSGDLCDIGLEQAVGDEEGGFEDGDGAAHSAVVDGAAAVVAVDDVVAGDAARHHDVGGERQTDGAAELGRGVGAEVDAFERHAVGVLQQDGAAALVAGKEPPHAEAGDGRVHDAVATERSGEAVDAQVRGAREVESDGMGRGVVREASAESGQHDVRAKRNAEFAVGRRCGDDVVAGQRRVDGRFDRIGPVSEVAIGGPGRRPAVHVKDAAGIRIGRNARGADGVAVDEDAIHPDVEGDVDHAGAVKLEPERIFARLPSDLHFGGGVRVGKQERERPALRLAVEPDEPGPWVCRHLAKAESRRRVREAGVRIDGIDAQREPAGAAGAGRLAAVRVEDADDASLRFLQSRRDRTGRAEAIDGQIGVRDVKNRLLALGDVAAAFIIHVDMGREQSVPIVGEPSFAPDPAISG